MNGSASSNVTKIARIFGTKISVCSRICVSAWNSDTTTPTTRPTTIKGDDTTTMVQIASRATSRVSAPVIFNFLSTLEMLPPSLPATNAKRLCKGALATKQSILSFRGEMDCFAALAMTALSDRHLHDVFVGLDHPVAHRHQRRDRDVGLRHCRHHVHYVGLAGGHRHGLGVGFLAGLQDGAYGILEQRAEGRAAGGLAALLGAAGFHDARKRGVGICCNGR